MTLLYWFLASFATALLFGAYFWRLAVALEQERLRLSDSPIAREISR